MEDFKAAWHSRLFEEKPNEKKKAKKELNELFDKIVSQERKKGVKASDYRTKLARVAEAYDISGEYFTGHTIKNFSWLRHPLINFKNDLNHMTAILSGDKSQYASGNIYMNPALLAIGHGDMDGDLIKIAADAFASGDMELFGMATQAYQSLMIDRQAKIDSDENSKNKKAIENITRYLNETSNGKTITPEQIQYGEVKKIDSVQDLSSKYMTAGAMFDAKKGAGIYGDLAFFFEKMLGNKKDFDVNNKENGIIGVGARSLHALAQSLYQKGINVKNADKLAKSVGAEVKTNYSEGEKGAMVLAQINSMFEMLNQSATFDDSMRFREFLEKGGTIGAWDLDAMYEGNALNIFGLGDLNEEGYKQILKIAEEHKANLEKSTLKHKNDYIKRIEKDIEGIKAAINGDAEAFKNITSELQIALEYDLNTQHQYFAGEGNSIGNQNAYRYRNGKIPGHEGTSGGIPYFNRVIESVKTKATNLSKEEQKKMDDFIDGSVWGIYQKIASAKDISNIKGVSPTRRTSSLKLNYGNNPDLNPIIDEIVNTEIKDKAEFLSKYSDKFVDIKGLKSMINSQIKGTIAHNTADALQKYGEDYANNSSYTGPLAQNKKILNFLNDENIAKEIVDEATEIGKNNIGYVTNLIEKQNGKIIGTEVGLAGFGGLDRNKNAKVSNQIADIIYKQGNKLTVGDWNIYGNDQPGWAPILQVYDYMMSLKTLQAAMNEVGAPTAKDFLFNETNNVSKEWRERIKRLAKTDGDREEAISLFEDMYN